MSRSKGGLISRIRQAIEGRQRTSKARYDRRNFLRLESLESRAMLTGVPPTAIADGPYTTGEEQELVVLAANGVLANDTDPESDPLTAVLVDNVDNGVLSLSNNGSFVYTPATNFVGSDTFTYRANDGTGVSNDITVTINVTAVNDAPVAVDDAYSMAPNSTLNVDVATGVLDDDTDVDDDESVLTATQVGAAVNGNVVLNNDGSFSFTPTPGFSGIASFQYEVEDDDGATSNTATVTITVNAAPSLTDVPDQVTTEGSTLTNLPFTVDDDQTDPAALSVTAASDNQTLIPNGSITLGGSGENRTITLVTADGEVGSATITITVTDANNAATTQTFLVTVNAPDTDPTIGDVTDQSTTEDNAIPAIGFTVGDAETDPADLTVTVASSDETLFPPGSITLGGSGASRTVALNPAANQSGTATITLTVTDGDGNSVTDTFVVTVTAQNDVPTITDVQNQTTPFNTPIVDLPFVIGDVDNDVAAFQPTATSDNQGLIPDANIVVEGTGANRTVTITPVSSQSGTALITLTVSDGAGGTTTDTFQVTVSANTAPTIQDVTDKTTTEDDAIVDIPVTVGDAETPVADLVLTATSDNQTLIPNGSITVGGSGANRTVTITPAANQFGTATITLTLSDGTTTVTDTFVVNVTEENDLPTLEDVGNQSVVENGAITNLEVSIDDLETADNDLTLTGSSNNTTLIPNSGIVISTTGGVRTVTITPADGEVGTATITLSLDDGDGGIVTDTFTVTVTANTPPTISEITDNTTGEDTALNNVTFTIGDTQTAAADLQVTATSSNTTLIPNASIVITGSGADRTISLTPASNESGTATITVTVEDANGGTTTETFVVTVTAANDLPTIAAISNQTVAVNGSIQNLPVTIDDVETAETALTLSGTSSNTTLVPNNAITFGGSGANRTVTITPATGQVGTAIITLTVQDADGGSSTQSFQVTVTGSNSAPTITAIGDQTTSEDTAVTGITFTVGDTETPLAELAVTATSSNTTLIPNNAIAITGSGADRTITVTPAANQSGTATITVTVDDGDGGTVTETFVVTVTAVNDLPTISNVADQTVNEDTATAGLAVTIGDVETPVANLQLTATSSNTTLVPNANIAITGTGANRTVVVTPAANQSGTATITLTVSDGNGGTSTETFVVNVTAVNDSPTAVNDTYSATEDTTLTISTVGSGVLANDTDPENQALTTVLVLAPTSGQLVLNNDGTFTYTPALNFTGAVTFQYRARDASNAQSPIATVTINVTGTNDAPTATGNAYTVTAGQTLTVNAANSVLTNDADPDSGTTLTAVLVNNTTNGTLTLNANGSFTYTPNAGFTGTDSFTYRASDGSLQSDPVTVTIAVSTAANSGAPIIVGPTSGVRGQTLTYTLSVTDGTSANVNYAIDWNGDGTNDQTVTGPGTGVTVTRTFATSGNFNVRVQTGSPAKSTVLPVSITDFQRSGSALVVGGTSGNDNIVVQQVRGGIRVLVNGTAVGGVQAGVKTVEINGGDGNDNISMPGNVNVTGILRGGAGNDRLVGGRVADFLFGDAGNDLLSGGLGSDFLMGGTGNDSLNGGSGHDVLFGGDGVDSLVGGSHHNLMIGGTTDFDTDFKAQKAILHAWAAGGTFEHRMNRLNLKSKGGLKLIEGDTVQADAEADRVVSSGSADWVFAALADQDQVTGRRKGRIVTAS